MTVLFDPWSFAWALMTVHFDVNYLLWMTRFLWSAKSKASTFTELSTDRSISFPLDLTQKMISNFFKIDQKILSCKIDIWLVNDIFEAFYKSGLLYIFHKLASSQNFQFRLNTITYYQDSRTILNRNPLENLHWSLPPSKWPIKETSYVIYPYLLPLRVYFSSIPSILKNWWRW